MRIKEVPNNGTNRTLFRQVARDTSGETFEPPAEEKIVFCYNKNKYGSESIVGAASYLLADKVLETPTSDFDSPYYHMVSYMFVKAYNQRQGYGKAMMRKSFTTMLQHVRRPIRSEVAQGAVPFFEKLGFTKTTENPVDCACSGSPLFSRLYRMEFVPPVPIFRNGKRT